MVFIIMKSNMHFGIIEVSIVCFQTCFIMFIWNVNLCTSDQPYIRLSKLLVTWNFLFIIIMKIQIMFATSAAVGYIIERYSWMIKEILFMLAQCKSGILLRKHEKILLKITIVIGTNSLNLIWSTSIERVVR